MQPWQLRPQGSPCTVRELLLTEPLVLPKQGARILQLVLAPQAKGEASPFRFYSSASSEGPWIVHAHGAVHRNAPPAANNGAQRLDAPDALKERLNPASPWELYEALGERGIQYGPAFQGITALWVGDGEALGELTAPAGVEASKDAPVHPALLDACLQLVGPTIGKETSEVFLPFRIESIEIPAVVPSSLYCYARLRPREAGNAETLTADLDLMDAGGRGLGRIQGLVAKRVKQASFLQGRSQAIGDWLYVPQWREQAGAGPILPADFLPQPDRLAGPDHLADADRAAASLLEPYREMSVQLEGLSRLYALQALQRLGWRPQPGGEVEAAGLAGRLGIAARHRPLLRRLLALFAEAGWLHPRGTGWEIGDVLSDADPEAHLDELFRQQSGGRLELTLLSRCGRQLAEVLAGSVDPLGLLFTGGDGGAAELYYTSPVARIFNGLAADALARAAASLPANRRLRVLEVGAGTGATSAAVLSRLPAARTDYAFTDLSPAFLPAAQERFTSYPFVTYRTLDIEGDVLGQGLSEQSYDVILASHVLHAVRDLPGALRQLKRLLAPGGLLLLVEGLRRQGWLDLTFGLLPGWWKFSDDWRADYPLLGRGQWHQLLAAEGFEGTSALSPAGLEDEQAVLLASAPREAAHLRQGGVWLVFADSAGLGARLAERLHLIGQRCLVVQPGECYENCGSGTYRLPPGSASAFDRLLAEALPQGERLAGVLHLWALNATMEKPATFAESEAAVQQGCASLLHLVQALARGRQQPPAGSWILTRAAQAVDGEEASAPEQGALWGLGRVIAREHPELRCRLIDLDPAGPDDEIEQLLSLLVAGERVAGERVAGERVAGERVAGDIVAGEKDANDPEAQLALRGSRRHVLRLARWPQPDRLLSPAGEFRLHLEQPAGSDSLRLREMVPLPPRTGEIQLRVRAAGANIGDCGDAASLGECAGEVIAVGPAVTGWQVGDAAFGLAMGAVASTVSTPASRMVAKPAGLTFNQAAAAPLAFITGALAWERAQLRSGDRVLIHAAAGGAGLAAVQLAQQRGAEIFATATADQHDYLRSLGVQHVFDSRSLDFAAGILTATNGYGVHVVLNSLSGGEYIQRTLSALAAGGRFVEIGRRGIRTAAEVAVERADVEYTILDVDEVLRDNPGEAGRLLNWLASGLSRGELQPLPQKIYPVMEAPAAFERMKNGGQIGKIVLRMPVVPERSGTWLITGGMRGLGLEVARWLAGRGVRHLALLGRRPPDEAAEAVLSALRNDGCQVLVLQGDVSSSEVVTDALQEVESTMPPLRGVVHAAGVLDDGALLNQDWERFRTVLGAKVQGAWLLDRLTAHYELDAFVLFSSMASLLGPAGQANHAAANAFLDALAHDRRRRGLAGTSINWGAWSGIGAVAGSDLEARLAAQGVGMIAPEQGLAVLGQVLRADAAQVVVLPIDWEEFNRQTDSHWYEPSV